jgi:hypothetical protein
VIHRQPLIASEWFIQLSDEIYWDVSDKGTGAPRAKVIMGAPATSRRLPADIRTRATRRCARCCSWAW